MDNSENCFAGALFFTLVSVGTFLKAEDVVISGSVGIISALIAAIFLKMGFSRIEDERDYATQQITDEIRRLSLTRQTSEYAEDSQNEIPQVNAISEVADAIREHFNVLQTNFVDLKILSEIAATNRAILEKLNNLNASADSEMTDNALKNIAENVDKTHEAINNLSTNLTNEIKKISDINSAGKSVSDEILYELRNPANAKEFEKIHSALGTLIEKVAVMNELKDIAEISQSDMNELVKIGKELSEQNQKLSEITANVQNIVNESMTSFSDTGEKFAATADSLQKMFDDMDRDMVRLTDKFETYNGLMRATLEQYSNLTDQDVTILEKIAEKLNGK